MKMLRRHLAKLGADESGATAIEYGLILSLMVIALVGALTSTGTATAKPFNDVSVGLTN